MLDVLGESVLTFSDFLNFDDLFLSKLAQLTYNKTTRKKIYQCFPRVEADFKRTCKKV